MKNIFNHLNQRSEFILAFSTVMFVIVTTYRFWFNEDKHFYTFLAPDLQNVGLVTVLFAVFMSFLVLTEFYFKNKPLNNSIYALFIIATCVCVGLLIFFQNGLLSLFLIVLVVRLNEYQINKKYIYFVVCIPLYFAFLNDLVHDIPYAYFNGAANSLLNLFGITFSSKIISEQKAKQRASHLVRELTATQTLLTFTSKRDERLRIARDLHDVLGHHLTALSIQLEVANHTDGQEAKKHVKQAQNIAKLLLSDIRQSVTDIRESHDIDIKSSLKKLCEGVPKINIQLNINQDLKLTNAKHAELIFRCVQEAITNILKHSNADQCIITLTQEGEQINLLIKDNGQCASTLIEGNGIQGMRERVSILDGLFNCNAGNDGFCIKITLGHKEGYTFD